MVGVTGGLCHGTARAPGLGEDIPFVIVGEIIGGFENQIGSGWCTGVLPIFFPENPGFVISGIPGFVAEGIGYFAGLALIVELDGAGLGVENCAGRVFDCGGYLGLFAGGDVVEINGTVAMGLLGHSPRGAAGIDKGSSSFINAGHKVLVVWIGIGIGSA